MSEDDVWQSLLAAIKRAGLEYKGIHRALTAFLVSQDCGADSEWLADIALDRVADKIHKGEQVRSMVAYSRKFAYLVWKEYCKDRDNFRKAMKDLALHVPNIVEFEENPDVRRQCQKMCFNRLSESDRKLLSDYYVTAKDREVLATDLGLLIATLRTKIHRLRLRLTECVESCRRSV